MAERQCASVDSATRSRATARKSLPFIRGLGIGENVKPFAGIERERLIPPFAPVVFGISAVLKRRDSRFDENVLVRETLNGVAEFHAERVQTWNVFERVIQHFV